MWLAVGLALATALSDVLMGLDILSVDDLPREEAPSAISYVAAGCYLLGGLLILLRRRWLWSPGGSLSRPRCACAAPRLKPLRGSHGRG